MPLGNSAEVAVGEPVAAIGSPFGNENSLTVGVVSATQRSIGSLTSQYNLVDAIQVDAPINHGNSGGPLFDAQGRVIGINAQIRSDTGNTEGVGFAVPINAARRSMEQLLATGKVAYAYVGMTSEDLTPGIARRFGYPVRYGAVITSVQPGSPGARAGLRGGSDAAGLQRLGVHPRRGRDRLDRRPPDPERERRRPRGHRGASPGADRHRARSFGTASARPFGSRSPTGPTTPRAAVRLTAVAAERRRLIVVSNRGPISYTRDEHGNRSARRGGGGLVTALGPLVSVHDVTWIANAMTDEDRVVARESGGAFDETGRDGSPYRLRLVDHDREDFDRFYNQFANPALWFLQHELAELIGDVSLDRAWESYRRVNETVAAAVLEELDEEPGTPVWFHDYHFYVAPSVVRAARPDAALSHFIHIPWPRAGAWHLLPDEARPRDPPRSARERRGRLPHAPLA